MLLSAKLGHVMVVNGSVKATRTTVLEENEFSGELVFITLLL